jgi:hypothetical protein
MSVPRFEGANTCRINPHLTTGSKVLALSVDALVVINVVLPAVLGLVHVREAGVSAYSGAPSQRLLRVESINRVGEGMRARWKGRGSDLPAAEELLAIEQEADCDCRRGIIVLTCHELERLGNILLVRHDGGCVGIDPEEGRGSTIGVLTVR